LQELGRSLQGVALKLGNLFNVDVSGHEGDLIADLLKLGIVGTTVGVEGISNLIPQPDKSTTSGDLLSSGLTLASTIAMLAMFRRGGVPKVGGAGGAGMADDVARMGMGKGGIDLSKGASHYLRQSSTHTSNIEKLTAQKKMTEKRLSNLDNLEKKLEKRASEIITGGGYKAPDMMKDKMELLHYGKSKYLGYGNYQQEYKTKLLSQQQLHAVPPLGTPIGRGGTIGDLQKIQADLNKITAQRGKVLQEQVRIEEKLLNNKKSVSMLNKQAEQEMRKYQKDLEPSTWQKLKKTMSDPASIRTVIQGGMLASMVGVGGVKSLWGIVAGGAGKLFTGAVGFFSTTLGALAIGLGGLVGAVGIYYTLKKWTNDAEKEHLENLKRINSELRATARLQANAERQRAMKTNKSAFFAMQDAYGMDNMLRTAYRQLVFGQRGTVPFEKGLARYFHSLHYEKTGKKLNYEQVADNKASFISGGGTEEQWKNVVTIAHQMDIKLSGKDLEKDMYDIFAKGIKEYMNKHVGNMTKEQVTKAKVDATGFSTLHSVGDSKLEVK
jgi:hypothetical protein